MSDVLVLCYHALSPTWPAELSVTPAAFEEQIGRLVRRGYRGATFADAVEPRRRGKTLVVTFDDAYRSVGALAAPILDRLGVPATVFVPTDWPDRGEPMSWPGVDHWLVSEHRDELMPMTWSQLGALQDRGWEIGSHTRSHPHLTAIADAELADELAGSREAVERRLGTPCRTIAYPYGDQDERVRRAAERAGYVAAAALSHSLREGDRFAWPRVGVWYGDSRRRFNLKTGRTSRRVRASRAFDRATGPRPR